MIKEEDSLIPDDWKRVAQKDWTRMKKHLDDDAEAVAYFLQQSLEKYLKAFLLQHGWKLKKIHALHDLISDAIKYNPALESFRKLCERVSGYYFTERYPKLVEEELSCEDVKKDIEEAKMFIN
ncbi:MAG: HEPN domain-containing protein [bacterium]